MEINSGLLKPLKEVKYLTAENCARYRVILRFFYLQYEKIKYWMYKEEIFEEIKKHPYFANYTIEQCQQDLDVLVSWGNLTPMQDTSRASTVEEFKNKQFRYQLSEYSVEIERLTIKLENIYVEGASLEPTLFERIKDEILRFKSMQDADIKTAGIWWRDLNNDFKRLNQNYQDYMRSFHTLKAEEMMKSREFIAYKDALIDYLREFVKELQKNVSVIEAAIKNIHEKEADKVLNKVFEYERSIPRIDAELNEEMMYDNLKGRWQSIRDWFIGNSNRESEAVKVFEITNEIIRKITRYAAQIAESRNSAANRKEEYKKLCEMFLKCEDIQEAHCLSAVSFGVFNTKHIRGDIVRETESVNSSIYEEEPVKVEIRPKARLYREKAVKNPIEDKSEKKNKLKEQYIKNIQNEKSIVESYIKDNAIEIASLPEIKTHVRITILKWIAKACASPDKKAKTEDGRLFSLIHPGDGKRCILRCEDGELEMPAYILKFYNKQGA